MAKIEQYPLGTPSAEDKILFTDVSDQNKTKNLNVSQLIGQSSLSAKSHLYFYTGQEYTSPNLSADAWNYLTYTPVEQYAFGGLTVGEDGVITYTGETKLITFSGVINVSFVNNSNVDFAFFYNDTLVTHSTQTAHFNQTHPLLVPGVGMLEMSDGDTLRLAAYPSENGELVLNNVNIILVEV
jgi:hypothetical protein